MNTQIIFGIVLLAIGGILVGYGLRMHTEPEADSRCGHSILVWQRALTDQEITDVRDTVIDEDFMAWRCDSLTIILYIPKPDTDYKSLDQNEGEIMWYPDTLSEAERDSIYHADLMDALEEELLRLEIDALKRAGVADYVPNVDTVWFDYQQKVEPDSSIDIGSEPWYRLRMREEDTGLSIRVDL